MQFLPSITSPADIKSLEESEILTLAGEIRETIINTVSKNGGHLASNLGMVETTLAIHRVFECPMDKILFDVGHQCYAHKLLTGRYARFGELRQFGGLSGFTNRDESEYDTVTAGHSGTALSTAIGIAEANRLSNSGNWTVAVVGDGSFTNGMVYEALNQLSEKKLRLVIVLNDNEMSISKNVGGLSAYLSMIRTSEGYFSFKMKTKRLFSRVPLIGNGLIAAARKVRDFVKRITNSETFFESLGIEYIGPVNGNDYLKMTSVLEEAKHKNCPVVVHIKTKKGLGYTPSEEHPERYHSTGAFSVDPTEPVIEAKKTTKTFADVSADLLLKLGGEERELCAITAAMVDGCGLSPFAGKYPERFFDVGIAEEHAIALAGGLALGGRRPVVVMYSTFAQRVFDQMWHDVCLQNANMVLLLSHCGLVAGDGVTHQGIYDAALFSSLPNLIMDSPDTFAAYESSLFDAISAAHPTVIRYPKGGEAKYPTNVKFIRGEHCKTTTFGDTKAGRRVSVITYGRISETVVKAAMAAVEEADVSVSVVILTRILPLSVEAEVIESILASDAVVFVEEGIRAGGIGESFAAKVGKYGKNVDIVAIEDGFLPHGDVESLTKYVGLDVDSVKCRLLGQNG